MAFNIHINHNYFNFHENHYIEISTRFFNKQMINQFDQIEKCLMSDH